jgi:anaerobic ribonucleoside-triphosphate reductase activating protein
MGAGNLVSQSIRLSRMHYPVTVLGQGTRIGIWVQGCSIHCRGCIAQDTWDEEGGLLVPVSQVVAQCQSWANEGLVEGVTVSGGEPFDQAEPLLALVRGLRRWLRSSSLDADILCYSGYPEATLRARYPTLLAELDALIPGPYRSARAPGGLWRGSSNQPIVPLTEIGRARYGSISDEPPAAPAVQVVVDEKVWMIGVPRPGDMERIEASLLERGVLLEGPSWR